MTTQQIAALRTENLRLREQIVTLTEEKQQSVALAARLTRQLRELKLPACQTTQPS